MSIIINIKFKRSAQTKIVNNPLGKAIVIVSNFLIILKNLLINQISRFALKY